MKAILDIAQNSAACNFISGMEWTGREWKRFAPPTFAEVAVKFPETVQPEDLKVQWGHGHYIEDDNGMPKCIRACWDTTG
jgi:hypothetical protein